jgi:hypothetical protein
MVLATVAAAVGIVHLLLVRRDQARNRAAAADRLDRVIRGKLATC